MTDHVVTNALDVDDFTPSMLSPDGAKSYGATLFDLETADTGVHVWKAEPGRFPHPGSDAGETFIVLTGRATIRFDDGIDHPIGPGSVVRVPPNTPSEMTVTELLQKVALTLH